MTRKEAAEKLKSLWYFLVNNDYPQKDLDALKVAIKALEQEPKAEVLDKIRAEIETDLSHFCFDEWGNENPTWKEIKAIIDKYKAESEDKE